MADKDPRTPKRRRFSRREFVRRVSAAGALYWIVPAPAASAAPVLDRSAIVSAVGRVLIPSAADDPGYRELEPHGITAEVLNGLSALRPNLLETWNESSGALFGGKRFLQLNEEESTHYLTSIISGELPADPGTLTRLRSVYKLLRARIFSVYYQNFPENRVLKDGRGLPLAADEHQISNPNSKNLVTGWDVANYPGPVTWDEEERLRARMKVIRWDE